MKKIIIGLLIFFLCLPVFLNIVEPAEAAGIDLVKVKGFDPVYYIDSRGIRHTFPNLATYQSWYGNDFSRVITVSVDFVRAYPLGRNITIRPGANLVKVQTLPDVYAIEPGGILRRIYDEGVAREIYGDSWNKKIKDVPDVFFSDYQKGNDIVKRTDLPDGLLLKDKSSGQYFYKSNGIVRPFASVADVLANRFKESEAIVSGQGFFVRQRPIIGFDKNIFNPATPALADTGDCENKNLKAAVILLTDQEYVKSEIDSLQAIKDRVSSRYSFVTDGLSAIDVTYPAVIMKDDGYLLAKRNDGTTDVKNEVINTFYDDHLDAFDFIFVWTNFKVPSEDANETAHFIPVSNLQKGINRDTILASKIYGSTGKLKGVIMMGDINKYDTKTDLGMDSVLNTVMHEILHQWSAYIGYSDGTEYANPGLLREPDLQHWSYYAGFISPLGGSGWIDNGNGTFTNALSKMANTNLRKYSELDLYLMGLLPAQMIDPVMQVIPKYPEAKGDLIEGTAKYITIDQIIKVNGPLSCQKK